MLLIYIFLYNFLRYIEKKGETLFGQRSVRSAIVSYSEDDFLNKTLFTIIKNVKEHVKNQVINIYIYNIYI